MTITALPASPPPVSLPPAAAPDAYRQQMLVISNGHLPPEIMEYLEEIGGTTYPFSAFLNEYGLILALPTPDTRDLCQAELAGTPLDDPRFYALLDYACRQGCAWLHADRDAPELPGLAVYDWC